MTTAILDRAAGPSPAAEAPTGTLVPVGAILPDDFDAKRQYVIPGCTTVELERYVRLEGPPNPLSRTLVDVVKAWVAG